LNGLGGDEVGNLINELIKEFLQSGDHNDVNCIGICVPGISYSKSGKVWAPNIPGWEDYPLKSKIKNFLGDKNINIHIESDRTCYILGEVWQGVAKECSNAIYLAVGTGIGAGILLDGNIIHGASDIVGATGWMALQTPYREEYIPMGCFEYYASGNGIARYAQELLRREKIKEENKEKIETLLLKKEIDEITSYDVFDAYSKNDIIATRVIDKAIEMWGMGTANLVSLFNPEKIIFGGGVFGPAVMFIERIYKEACKWGQPISMKQVEFCASGIKGDSALLGAAYLAIRENKKINNI
jgi:Transcriptional regulator/sugar kinase